MSKTVLILGVSKKSYLAYVGHKKVEGQSYGIYSSSAKDMNEFKNDLAVHLINLEKEAGNENLPEAEQKRIRNRYNRVKKIQTNLEQNNFKTKVIEGNPLGKMPKSSLSNYFVFG